MTLIGWLAEEQDETDGASRLSARAKEAVVEVRLAVGDALFVDNQRVLHGRRAIAEGSRRRLWRVWVRG